jgi:tetratricopeptide (TPR) repeat protein
LVNWGIVAATVLLATLPVVGKQYRKEMARWYLAAATNSVANNPQDVDGYLQRAQQSVPDIHTLRDYWLFSVKRSIQETPEQTVDVVRQAIQQNGQNWGIGIYAGDVLYNQGDFKAAVDVLELAYDGPLRHNTMALNQLAYFRSLAAIDLDEALEDIEIALGLDPDNAAYRDTRAWVLFQMGKPLEALSDANFAIEALAPADEEPADGVSSDWFSWNDWLAWLDDSLAGRPEPRAQDRILSRREAGEELWGQGALYYHRARILEALGRIDEAEADYQWLRDHSLPTDDRIY